MPELLRDEGTSFCDCSQRWNKFSSRSVNASNREGVILCCDMFLLLSEMDFHLWGDTFRNSYQKCTYSPYKVILSSGILDIDVLGTCSQTRSRRTRRK